MSEINKNPNFTSRVTQKEAYGRTRDFFLGQSLTPTQTVPDLLAENRKIAIKMAENVMVQINVIAEYFGISAIDLVMSTMPEVSLDLEADGIREKAAAKTYIDLRGTVPLTDICKGTHAYPIPTLHCVADEILRRERVAKYSPHDPLLMRIFRGIGENENSGATPNEESSESVDGETVENPAPDAEDPFTQDAPSGV